MPPAPGSSVGPPVIDLTGSDARAPAGTKSKSGDGVASLGRAPPSFRRPAAQAVAAAALARAAAGAGGSGAVAAQAARPSHPASAASPEVVDLTGLPQERSRSARRPQPVDAAPRLGAARAVEVEVIDLTGKDEAAGGSGSARGGGGPRRRGPDSEQNEDMARALQAQERQMQERRRQESRRTAERAQQRQQEESGRAVEREQERRRGERRRAAERKQKRQQEERRRAKQREWERQQEERRRAAQRLQRQREKQEREDEELARQWQEEEDAKAQRAQQGGGGGRHHGGRRGSAGWLGQGQNQDDGDKPVEDGGEFEDTTGDEEMARQLQERYDKEEQRPGGQGQHQDGRPGQGTRQAQGGQALQFLELDLGSAEAHNVLGRFNQTMGQGRVVRIEKVWNPALWGHYQQARAQFGNEQQLWHGSSQDAITAICRRGFDVKKADPGGLLGAGVYAAETASYSDNFSRKISAANLMGAPLMPLFGGFFGGRGGGFGLGGGWPGFMGGGGGRGGPWGGIMPGPGGGQAGRPSLLGALTAFGSGAGSAGGGAGWGSSKRRRDEDEEEEEENEFDEDGEPVRKRPRRSAPAPRASPRFEPNGVAMMLCYVALGTCVEMPGGGRPMGYHHHSSSVGSGTGQGIYAVYTSYQIFPAFVVHYA